MSGREQLLEANGSTVFARGLMLAIGMLLLAFLNRINLR